MLNANNNVTINKITFTAIAEKDDLNFRLQFSWPNNTYNQSYSKTATFKEARTGGTAQYPLGNYKLNLSLWFDEDGNGIIDKEDESVPFGNYDVQSKTITFDFRAEPPQDCSAEPKVEIIYPMRGWFVSKTLKHVGQGVNVTLWDDCNQINNITLYDEKSYKLGKEAARALEIKTSGEIANKVNILLGKEIPEEKQNLFNYNDKENFNLIVRAIDKQKHSGEDRVYVTFSGEGGETTTELLSDSQCASKGGECTNICASSALILGTCTPEDGQARVCCKKTATTTATIPS